MGNNNSLPRHNQVEENNNNDQENINILNAQDLEALAAFYQPPVSFNCVTDNPRTRSSLILLQMPRVPFIVSRRVIPGFPTTAVTFGVVPLRLCEDYEDFMLLLRQAFRFCLQETLEGPAILDDPIPGYELLYEMMGPVRMRVPFLTHSWRAFKDRVRLVVLEKRA